MQAIQQGESPIIAVMPTGSDKSMLFIVPAFTILDGITVVVVLLITLQIDMQRQYQQLGISYKA